MNYELSDSPHNDVAPDEDEHHDDDKGQGPRETVFALAGPLSTGGELGELALEVVGLDVGGGQFAHLALDITHQTVQTILPFAGVHADSAVFAGFASLKEGHERYIES